jgi:hypothetical protein
VPADDQALLGAPELLGLFVPAVLFGSILPTPADVLLQIDQNCTVINFAEKPKHDAGDGILLDSNQAP